MWSRFFICAIFLIRLSSSAEIKQRICSRYVDDNCVQLARDRNLECYQNAHSVDCALNIRNGITDLGLLHPEEAFLASSFMNENVQVLAEVFWREKNGTLRQPYKTVVVVKSDYQGGLAGLKGKKYCHPGFKHDERVTRYILEEFENAVLSDKYDCNSNTTLVEKHIKALSEFFSSVCRPGQWTFDMDLDAKLKSKYPNVCDLCGSSKCDTSYVNPFQDSLNCLVKNNADVAVSTVRNLDYLKNNYPNQYKVLCKDGRVTTLDYPCTWTNQLPSVIIGRREKSQTLQAILRRYFPNLLAAIKDYKPYISTILDIKPSQFVKVADTPISLPTYVKSHRIIPDMRQNIKCTQTLRWCTKNEAEQWKCQWMSQAAINEGIQPVIDCIQSDVDSDMSCLADIKTSKSDIFSVDTDYAYTAAKYSLSPIAFPETDTRYVKAVQVVLSDSTTAQHFKDLKGKKACIPRFGGKEMLIFSSYLKAKHLAVPNPDYGQIMAKFLGQSCLPGTKQSDVTSISEKQENQLCSLCTAIYTNQTALYCTADYVNKYYKNPGSMKCLTDGAGDFAVVTSTEIPQNTTLTKVLCKNDSMVTANPALVDEDCALNVIVDSEIIARTNEDANNQNFILALRSMEKLFGENINTPFHLFSRFNNTKNLLFKDSTPGLRFTSTDVYIENLKRLVSEINQITGDSQKVFSSLAVLLFSCVCFLLIR